MKNTLKRRHWITAIVLVLLMGAAVAGLYWTRELPAQNDDTAATNSKKNGRAKAVSQRRQLVDLRPLETARRMAALASTPNELALAHEAEKVGDHAVDLAFYDAIRIAQENPRPLSPEAKQIASRKNKAQEAVQEDEDRLAELNRSLAAASGSHKDALQDQIDVVKAQLELDQDELDDASEDLEQAGGDPESKIKRLQSDHEATDHNASPAGSAVNQYERDYQAHTLLAVGRAWQALRDKRLQLEQARAETIQKQQRMVQRHAKLEAQLEQEKQGREAVKEQAKGLAAAKTGANDDATKAAAVATVASLKQFTLDQKTLADFGRRMQDEQDLSDIYSSWIELVDARERMALHHIIEALLAIVIVLFVLYLAARVIDRLFTGFSTENKRIDTLRAVVKFAVQALGALVIVFIILGMPTQTTTVLGLAGAGLTVAMKDFIVAFFGWFILMGQNGIRVGDWVEIDGVSGEVVEVGLLKTVLLETGNWTDASHPTGRRVSFVNSFAIEGHFFNFTSSGQWMWDEVQVLIPPNQDPYAVIDAIQKLVEQETATNAAKAEAEWRETASRYRAKSLSAVPGVSVVPTGSGIEVRVRYITRAYERHEARKRIYEAVVSLLHGRREAVRV